MRAIFEDTQVFEKAELLVEKARSRTESIAEQTEPKELRQLLTFFIETILTPEETPDTHHEDDPVLVPLSMFSTTSQ